MKIKKPLPRIVLAGSTGYIGQELVNLLLDNGYSIICPCRNTKDINKYDLNHPNLSLINYENLKETIEKSEFKPSILVSCIASRSGGVKDSWKVEYDLNMELLKVANQFQFKKFQ